MKIQITTIWTHKANIAAQCLLYTFVCIGAIYTTSYQFTDSHILPKLVAASVGAILLAIYFVIRHLFFPMKISNHNGSKIKAYIISIFILMTAGQALYGILQFLGFMHPITNFPVTGSFDNPAGFAASLCAAFPFYIYAFLKITGCWRWIIGSMAILLIAAVVLSESRAGILSLSAVLVLWGLWRFKLRKTIKWMFLPLLLAGIVVALYFLKKDSADGRLLIWKCSLEMIKDNGLFGYGTGGFETHYMDYQADYFKRNPDSVYAQLADTVQHPFNEYIGLAVNYGVIGLLLLFAGVGWLLYCYFKHPILENKIAISCWLSVGVFAFFSYPLMYPFVWMMLLYSAYLLVYERINFLSLYLVRYRLAIGSVSICILAYTSTLIYWYVEAELQWKKAYNIALLGKTEKALNQYKKVYAQLKTDRYFLYNYSAEFYQAEKHDESLDIALKCRKHWADYDLELLIGENYQQQKDFISAERYYKSASLMCPSKFVPLYRLFKLYKQSGKNRQAYETAEMLINKPIKIPSTEIRMIKREMGKEILQIQK